MDKYKILLKNFGIFAFGTLGSKMVSFFLLPFYTYMMTADEFGQVDILLNIIPILLPIVTINIVEGVFRFTLDTRKDKEVIISTTVMFLFLVAIILVPLIVVINNFITYKYMFYLVSILFVQMFQEVFKQYARAIGKIKVFVATDIIHTLVFSSLNIYLLGALHKGVEGYLFSVLFAYFVDMIILIITCKIYRIISINKFNVKELEKMLKFTLPTVANGLMLWVIAASDRFFIVGFLGYAAGGIYSVANKFSTLLTLINTVFFKAFQISAVENFESEDISNYYEKIFGLYSSIMIILSSFFIMIIQVLIRMLLEPSYHIAWKYSSVLFLAAVFACFSNFFSTIFVSVKKTKVLSHSSIIAGIINIIFNFLLISQIGILGACLSTLLSYVIMCSIRVWTSQKIIKFNLFLKESAISFVIIILQIVISYLQIGIYSRVIISSILSILVIVVNINKLTKIYDVRAIVSRLKEKQFLRKEIN